ncbi:hypothetical protein [Kutzneria kofuensis]|uniref:Uncharacterized protein n=1 Tax=Kutzneria kofuensis TaxID=103725 RepID=A0A7W9NF62_9PSEU|nr:hypothetical protein [Kutzneria kofuensis]MBB5889673.1 hypothetical protein [Kutzneria kofuensis]
MSTVVSDRPALQHRSMLDDVLWQRLVSRVRMGDKHSAEDDKRGGPSTPIDPKDFEKKK